MRIGKQTRRINNYLSDELRRKLAEVRRTGWWRVFPDQRPTAIMAAGSPRDASCHDGTRKAKMLWVTLNICNQRLSLQSHLSECWRRGPEIVNVARNSGISLHACFRFVERRSVKEVVTIWSSQTNWVYGCWSRMCRVKRSRYSRWL